MAAQRNRRPTKAEIEAIVRSLRPGQQRALGGGIYLRLDSNGRVRYQLRLRMAGRGSRHLGNTYDSWDVADRARRCLLARKENGNRPAPAATKAAMTFEKFADEQWWEKHVLEYCDAGTQLYYGETLERDLLPYWSGYTLGAITREHGRAFQKWLKQVKRHTRGPRKGELAPAAVDRAMAVFGRILNYAVEEGVLELNPCAGIRSLDSTGATRKPKVREVQRAEIFTPTEVERIRRAFSGCDPWSVQCRALVSVLAYLGVRPGEALALKHRDWRSRAGARTHIRIDKALKDLAGYLIVGPIKNRKPRDVILWTIVAEELEQLYQAQGSPTLGSPVFPGHTGGPFRFNNWRDRTWYDALLRAGISSKPNGHEHEPACPSDEDAREPYALRHTCVTLMHYASKPNGGRYTIPEIAAQHGHSPRMTLDVYGHVMRDDREIAGKTMDQAIHEARYSVFGPQPGDQGFIDDELTTVQAAELTAMSVKTLNNRIRCRTIAAQKRGSRWMIRRAELARAGLLTSEQ